MRRRLRAALSRLPLDWAVPATLAATVVSFALGSTRAATDVLVTGRPLRWAALVVLAVLAVAYALVHVPRVRLRPELALAAFLAALALVSALWSPRPSLTVARAATLAVLLVAAAAVSLVARARPGTAERVLGGVLAGAAAIAVAGLVVLAADQDRAVEPATAEYPARYNGLGENPNTVAMVLALGVPLALWLAIRARTPGLRVLAAALGLLLVGSIVGSASRGALLASLAAALVVGLLVPRTMRRRLASAAAAVTVFVVAVGITQIPDPAPARPAPPVLTTRDAQAVLPLEEEIGFDRSEGAFHRSLLTTSGRVGAWRGAVRQAAERPVVGYGFGTEDRVFVDHYRTFFASRVENSYISAALQLGVVGAAALLGLVVALAAPLLRAMRTAESTNRQTLAACGGVLAAGLVLALTQSYMWSVGNVATVPFWICAFLVPAVASARATR